MAVKTTYRFTETNDVSIHTNLFYRSFDSEWLTIATDGKITVKGSNNKGYAWDGFSPKKNILDICVGTPDGKTVEPHHLPITYFASMFHDCIYQYKKKVPISRHECDLLFLSMLHQQGFYWSDLYYSFVRVFGWYYGNWQKKTTGSTVKVKGLPERN